MLIGRVVDHEIENDPHPELVHLCYQFIHVCHCAIWSMYSFVIGDVVSHIYLWALVHRADPDHVDADRFDILKTLSNATQVADAIAVRILEGCRVDLINHGIFPPRLFRDSHSEKQRS